MSTYPEDSPKNFREVAIALASIRRELTEVKVGIERVKSWVIMGLACPVIVGVVLALIFKL